MTQDCAGIDHDRGHRHDAGAECSAEGDSAWSRPPDLGMARPVIERAVCQVFAIEQRALVGQSRGRANVALARQVAMYLGHTVLELTLTDTGELFERDRTTVAHACQVVEDRRDDRIFDYVLELLETIIKAQLAPRVVDVRLYN